MFPLTTSMMFPLLPMLPIQRQRQRQSQSPWQGQGQGQGQSLPLSPVPFQSQGGTFPGPVPSPDPTAFIFTQLAPALIWTINHNLSAFPSVTLVDTLGNTIVAQVQYTNSNQVVVTFSQPVAGSAFLNV
jgi:hypothetical protein